MRLSKRLSKYSDIEYIYTQNTSIAVKLIRAQAEHPVKTRQGEFMKMFPDVELEDNIIKILPCEINTKIKDKCYRLRPCYGCRKKYWLAEVE